MILNNNKQSIIRWLIVLITAANIATTIVFVSGYITTTTFSATTAHKTRSFSNHASVVVTKLNQAAIVQEESEWYVPPPAPVKKATTVVKKPIQQTLIRTKDEFYNFLNDNNDKFIVVKFYASWCKSCAKFGMKLDQFASKRAMEYGDTVRIVHVEYAASKELCQEVLTVHKLPTVHMYMKNFKSNEIEKVQDFPCPPKEFYKVEDYTKYYVQRLQKEHQQAGKKKRNFFSLSEKRERKFEQTLDMGHTMIDQQLSSSLNCKAKQLEIAAQQVYFSTSTTSPDTTIATTVQQDNNQREEPLFKKRKNLLRGFGGSIRRRLFQRNNKKQQEQIAQQDDIGI